MKTLKTTLVTLILALASVSAFAQDLAPIIATFALTTTNFAGSGTSNYTILPTYGGQTVTLKAHNGIAIMATVGCTNGTTAASPVGFKFELSPDNVTWTTTLPITNSVTMNGTNTVTGYTLFPYTTLDHMRYIRLAQIINGQTNIINLISLRAIYFNNPM